METHRLKILAIDDNRDNLTALRAVIAAAFPEAIVMTALDGRAGAEAALAEDPDVILLDIVMPGMERFEVCRNLKQDERLLHIPVVFLTALKTSRENRIKALEAGAEGFLSKPLDEQELIAQIRAMVKIKNAARGQQLEKQQLAALVVERTRALELELADRKRVEVNLREERALYQDLVNTQPAGIYRLRVKSHAHWASEAWRSMVDSHFSVDMVSVRFCEIMGIGREDFLTNPGIVPDLIHPDDRAGFSVMNAEALAAHAPFSWDGRLIQGRWIHFESIPRVLENGDTLWTGILWDITERKKTENERERLMAAIEQTGEIIIITDPEGIIQYVNPAFTAVTGYSRQETLGQSTRILKSGKQDKAFYRELWQTIASGKTWEGRLINKRKDGRLYTEEAIISPVWNAAGQIVDFVAVKRDITEHLRLESQFLHAQKMDSVGRLAGGVAHDFNNMLCVILGFTELALRKVDTSHPLHANLVEVLTAAKRSAEITRQLLAFARKQTIAPRVLDLNETVEGMLKMLRRLIGENIDLAWLSATGLWPVRMDPAQLDQILANLCVNARDAIADIGRVVIETGNVVLDEDLCIKHAGVAPGEYVLLAVSDNGCGMDRETLGKIFEPFFTTKGVGQGTGLGLATVYGIVKQNDGFIDVESEVGTGTTFNIYLPRHMSRSIETQGPASAEIPISRGETILVVEDEVSVLELAGQVLRGLGYTVLTAGTPHEALSLAEAHAGELQLLITDVILPEMNGRDLAARIRASRPVTRCLFMSGYTADMIAHRGVLDEGIQFIQKPFLAEALAAKVRDVLDR